MSRHGGFALLLLSVSTGAFAQHRSQLPVPAKSGVSTDAEGTKVLSSSLDSSDAQAISDALRLEMGDSCVPTESESPRIKVSLANMKKVSESMISQFTKMVQDEIVEKRGPIKIGPPEIMNQMLANPRSISSFGVYNSLRTQSPRGSSSAARKAATLSVEEKYIATNGDQKDVDVEALHKAGELAAELAPIINHPLIYMTRGNFPPMKNALLGVSLSDDRTKFFSSLEEVAPALPAMNAYLDTEANGLKRDTAMVNALADGLALSIPTAIIGVAKQSIAASVAKTAQMAIGSTAAAATQVTQAASSSSAQNMASTPVKFLFLATVMQTLGNDLRATLTNLGNAEVRTKTKEAIGLVPVAHPSSASESSPSAAGIPAVNRDIENAVIESLPTVDSSDGKKIVVPNTVDPKTFTDRILAIRDATKSYFNDPELLRSTTSKNANASSALNATQGTLTDTRASNDALVLNMQSFFNTSQRARADYVAMADLLATSKNKTVPRSDIEKLSNTLDSDVNLMLEKMDDSTSILSNQSEYFSKGMTAIEAACASDSMKIYQSWGKYRRVFRDKIGVSPWSGPVSPARAYLADAVLSRADCVNKKSIARRMEMMRLGAVLTQFKSSCEDVKSWSSANMAYKSTRESLIAKSKANTQRAVHMPVMREVGTQE
ncbi:MAG: hypothetical protein ABIR96_02785 [Bdellovibrionota bacterium]